MEKKTLYERIKEGLAVASQFIIAAPLRLPPKVVAVARYVALALGVLEAVENAAKDGERAMKTTNLQLGIGTGSGTLLSMLGFIGAHDMLKTAALAAIGAVVSFAVSWVLQKWGRKR